LSCVELYIKGLYYSCKAMHKIQSVYLVFGQSKCHPTKHKQVASTVLGIA